MVPVKPREFGEHPNVKTRAIPSQAEQECAEGVTSNAYGPDRTMRQHERGAMKFCSKCESMKLLELFSKNAVWCKSCVSEYDKAIYQRKRHIILEQKRKYRARNKERRAAANKKWQAANRDYVVEYGKKWREENRDHIKAYLQKNRHKVAFWSNLRSKRIVTATPKWANLDAIKAIYEEAQNRTDKTGIPHEVDHIVPLVNKIVCGLHVEHNLRVITRKENAKKKNRLIDDVL